MINSEWYKNEQFILTTQAKQVFYLEDPSRNRNWKVVEEVNHRKIWDHPSIDDDNEVDVVHDGTSSNFVLTVELGELEIMHLDRPGHTSIIGETSRSVLDVDDDFINDDDDDEISKDDLESTDDDVGIDIDEE